VERAMTAKDKDLNDLFLDTLKDIYFLFCRKADFEGAAENGQSGQFR
jgi:hypothetical protein